MDSLTWQTKLPNINNCIIFFDEAIHAFGDHKFAEYLKKSNNYFVIISRENFGQIEYSVSDIYELRYDNGVSRTIPFYSESKIDFSPTHLLTEDEKAGHQFYKYVTGLNNSNTLSVQGKDNFVTFLESAELKGGRILLCFDSIKFGDRMVELYSYIKSDKDNDYCIFYTRVLNIYYCLLVCFMQLLM